MTITIGIISDTHGKFRPEVGKIFAGCHKILHAGDVGDETVLKRLERIAPVVAVRGNMDRGPWSQSLPVNEMVEVAGILFYILHDLHHLDLEPSAAGVQMIVSGHTHRPEIVRRAGVIYLNPGSAGRRRFNYPVSVATARIENGVVIPRIIEIDV